MTRNSRRGNLLAGNRMHGRALCVSLVDRDAIAFCDRLCVCNRKVSKTISAKRWPSIRHGSTSCSRVFQNQFHHSFSSQAEQRKEQEKTGSIGEGGTKKNTLKLLEAANEKVATHPREFQRPQRNGLRQFETLVVLCVHSRHTDRSACLAQFL